MKTYNNKIENLVSVKELQAIVEKTGTLIQKNVAIWNSDGFIIAATLKNRMGVFSEQIKKMIETEDDVLLIEEKEKGTSLQPGINLLVRYEKIPVAIVGVTGKPDEVKIYGKLIQAFVQQQITSAKKQREQDEYLHHLNQFIYNWAVKGIDEDDTSFAIKGQILNINVNSPRIACVIAPENEFELFDVKLQKYIEDKISKINKQHIFTRLSNQLVILLQLKTTDEAKELIEEIYTSVKSAFSFKCAIGIGCVAKKSTDVKFSYEMASMACKVSKNTLNNNIIVFGYNMELLVSTVSPTYKQVVFNHIFRNYKTIKQIEESAALIKHYVESNRSIKKIAKDLFLHENTIQNRLNRIYELTGYNPRNSKDLVLLYTTSLFYETELYNKDITNFLKNP